MGTTRSKARCNRQVWMKVKNPEQIRRWRLQRGYTQRDLAYLVKKSQGTIWSIEAGRLRTIDTKTAMALAARLDVPWEELFEPGGNFDMYRATNVQQNKRNQALSSATNAKSSKRGA